MKALIAVVVALVLGLVGFVVVHESNKQRSSGPVVDEFAVSAVISTGERVDIDAHVPRQGLTIVEFTADF